MEKGQFEFQELKKFNGEEYLENIKIAFPENTNFLDLLRVICNTILESNDPIQLIHAINLLRRLEKHDETFFI